MLLLTAIAVGGRTLVALGAIEALVVATLIADFCLKNMPIGTTARNT